MSEHPIVVQVEGGDRRVHVEDGSIELVTVSDSDTALERADDSGVDCVVTPYVLAEEGKTGLDLLAAVRKRRRELPVILWTADPDGDVAADATRQGVTEYVPLSSHDDPSAYLATRARAAVERSRAYALDDLIEATRQLLTARTQSDVATVTERVATTALGFEYASVRLSDDETERRGRRALRYPLGEHGTLTLGATDRDALDEFDRRLATLLAANATAALERTYRMDELRRYETVFEGVQDMMVVLEDDGRISMVTDPLVEWTGYDRDEFVGESAWDFLPADSRERSKEAFGRIQDGSSRTETVRIEVRAADGSLLPAQVDASALQFDDGTTGIVGAVHDISDLVETRAELDQERDRFAQLFEHIPDPVNEVTFVDGEPIIEATNAAFERVFGHEEREIVGESANEILPPATDRETAREIDRRTREDAVASAEVRRQTVSGLRHFLFRGLLHDEDEARAFGIYTDITEQHRRERRLQVLQRVLRHNLRNEMSIVGGYASLASDGIDDEEAGDHLEIIEDRADALASLSDKVRQIERVFEREDAPLRSVDPSKSIDAVRRTFDEPIEADVDPSVRVVGDDRIEIALENVIENAIEHGSNATHPWDPTVDERSEIDGTDVGPAVEVVCEPCPEEPEGWVVVRVLDDGPGIPEHERSVVTDELDVTQLTHGSGLGLWLVAWVVQSLGGDLSFDDRDPRGSVVTIRLRRAE